MDHFGTRIRDARLALGLGLSVCARGLLPAEALARIEHGSETPDPVVAVRIAARLHMPAKDREIPSDAEFAASLSAEAALRRGDHTAVAEQLLGSPSVSGRRPLYRAYVAERRGDLTSAAQILQSEAHDESPLWRFRRLLALCRVLRDIGELGRSIAAGEAALSMATDAAFYDLDLLLELRSTLSGTYCETGDLVRAIDLTEPLPGNHEISSWANATRLWARAMALQTAGRFALALEAAHESLLLLQHLGRPAAFARLQNSAAWIAMQLPSFDTDRVNRDLEDSARFFRSIGAPLELALVLTSQSEFAVRTNRHAEARGMLAEVDKLLTQAEAGERARIMAAAAQLFARMGDLDEANRHLLSARELLENSGAKRSAAAVWKQMAETYASLGQQDLQIVCLRAAMDLLEL